MNLGDRLIAVFDDPTLLWQRVFDNELDELARRVFLTVVSMRGPASVDDLQSCLARQPGIQLGVQGILPALSVLDDTMLSHMTWQGESVADVLNPGLTDFGLAQFNRNPMAVNNLRPFAFLEQHAWLLQAANEVRETTPEFPGIHRYFESGVSGLLTEATSLLNSPAARRNGLHGTARLMTILDMAAVANDSDLTLALPTIAQGISREFSRLLEGQVRVALVEALHRQRIRRLLESCLGQDPVVMCRIALLKRDHDLSSMRVVEALRKVEPFTIEDEQRLRKDLADKVRYLHEDIDSVGLDEASDMLDDLEHLTYWLPDDQYGDTKDLLREVVQAAASDDDYDDTRPAPRSEVDSSDAEIAALFQGLLEERFLESPS